MTTAVRDEIADTSERLNTPSAESDRDENGRFARGNTPKNAWPKGYRPSNRCPSCGLGRSKAAETDEYIRWYCSRCDRTFTARRTYYEGSDES